MVVWFGCLGVWGMVRVCVECVEACLGVIVDVCGVYGVIWWLTVRFEQVCGLGEVGECVCVVSHWRIVGM